uniref:Reverse transcriptase domain-containing protein n=1 Tax=Nicotiana tabacum TaxID=4097 RepID=A0A1S3X787_TOBAC|nr:PREDICTED: uncharacterized protein LOC107761960 [Nicotiana tabacum]
MAWKKRRKRRMCESAEANFLSAEAMKPQKQRNSRIYETADVLHEIPNYAKYIKDIVAHKKRLTEFEIVSLTEECTSRVQTKLSQKLKDPGSFTILVRIGNIDLADRSIAYPEGVIEDVLLQIGKFIFPADFIILDYEADEHVPILLGRPFLATGDAIIKVREGKMIMSVDNEEAVFNIYKAIQIPCHYEELSMISVVEMDEQLLDTSVYLDDSLEKALMLFNSLEIDDEVDKAKVEAIEKLLPPTSIKGIHTEGGLIKEIFPDEQLLAVTSREAPWYEDYVNFIASGVTPPEVTPDNRRRFLHDVRLYMWDDPFLYRQCADQLVRRCVPEEEMNAILHDCHASPYGGHHGGDRTAQKVPKNRNNHEEARDAFAKHSGSRAF